jgi:hypothetical protein
VTSDGHARAHDGDGSEVVGACAGVASEREDGGRVRERIGLRGVDAAVLGESSEDRGREAGAADGAGRSKADAGLDGKGGRA